MPFVPSQASYGAMTPDGVMALSQLVTAGTHAGVAVGGAIRARRGRKRRKGRRQAALPALPAPLPPAASTSWGGPLAVAGLLGVIGLATWWAVREES